MSKHLMEYFYKQPRLGILSTADKNGKVNFRLFRVNQKEDSS
jgi:hypothetical protein